MWLSKVYQWASRMQSSNLVLFCHEHLSRYSCKFTQLNAYLNAWRYSKTEIFKRSYHAEILINWCERGQEWRIMSGKSRWWRTHHLYRTEIAAMMWLGGRQLTVTTSDVSVTDISTSEKREIDSLRRPPTARRHSPIYLSPTTTRAAPSFVQRRPVSSSQDATLTALRVGLSVTIRHPRPVQSTRSASGQSGRTTQHTATVLIDWPRPTLPPALLGHRLTAIHLLLTAPIISRTPLA